MNLNPNKKENPKGYKEIWESREMSYVVLMKSQDSSFHSRFHGDNKLSIPRSTLSASSLVGVDLRAPLPLLLPLERKMEEEIEKVSDYMSRSWRSCESFVGISWTCHQTSLWKISYVPANGLIFGLDG